MRAAALTLALVACAAPRPGPQLHRDAYPDGHARFEFETRAGLPHGLGRAWHPNGALHHVGSYAEGARHGRFWFFTEAGAFDHQAVFVGNDEVWRSSRTTDQPPAEWTRELPSTPRPALERAYVVQAAPAPVWLTASRAPVPTFSTLDRTTGPARGGVQLGVGSAEDLAFGAVTRLDVFGHYRFGPRGVYGQLSQTLLAPPDGMRLSGRRTLDAGGTSQRDVPRLGTLTGRAGLLLPIGHDDTRGFIASAAGASQRAADAAASFPSSMAVRTSASLTRRRERLVLQADVGVDWLLGGEARAVDAVLRAGAGAGYGSRRALLTVELGSALRASDPGRHLLSVGVGGTVAHRGAWVSACVSLTQDRSAALITTVGHDL